MSAAARINDRCRAEAAFEEGELGDKGLLKTGQGVNNAKNTFVDCYQLCDLDTGLRDGLLDFLAFGIQYMRYCDLFKRH